MGIVHHRSCSGPRTTGDYCLKVGAIASYLINKLYHCKHLLLLNENGGFCQLSMIKVFVLWWNKASARLKLRVLVKLQCQVSSRKMLPLVERLKRRCDVATLWRYDITTLRHYDVTTLRRYDITTLRRYDATLRRDPLNQKTGIELLHFFNHLLQKFLFLQFAKKSISWPEFKNFVIRASVFSKDTHEVEISSNVGIASMSPLEKQRRGVANTFQGLQKEVH